MAENDFSPAELKQLQFHFKTFDVDGDNHITESELKEVLARLGEKIDDSEWKQIIAAVDTNRNGTIEYNEYINLYKLIKGNKGDKLMDKLKKTTKQISVQGSVGTHSYTEEEKEAFVHHINSVLQGDPHLSKVLPLNPDNDSLFKAVHDGVLLCKLINTAVPGTIDERVLNLKEKKNAWEINENQSLLVNSAKGIGCQVVNIGPEDLKEGRAHLVLGLVWQIIRIGLLSNINLQLHPELVRLLRPGEELGDLLKLPPEQLLLRWVNYHLEQAGTPKRIANFSNDIKDSEAYTHLLKQISPNHVCGLGPLNEKDQEQRADAMLKEADKIGCRKFIAPRDVVRGNPKLNLAFVANLFNTYPALDPVDTSAFADLLNFDAEGTREERAFRFWIQSLGFECNNLFEDVRDGLLILQIMDKVQPGVVDWKKVNKTCPNKYKKVENCNYAVELAKNPLKFSVVNIGGTDIVDGNKKLILGIIWQLMRLDIVNMLKKLSGAGKPITDNDIVAWANDAVKTAGRGSSMNSFKDATLKTGVFLIDLCYAVSPRSVNMDLVTPGESDKDAEMNAKYAISVARKIGATLFLLWEDIVEVNPKMIMTFVGGLMAVSKNVQ